MLGLSTTRRGTSSRANFDELLDTAAPRCMGLTLAKRGRDSYTEWLRGLVRTLASSRLGSRAVSRQALGLLKTGKISTRRGVFAAGLAVATLELVNEATTGWRFGSLAWSWATRSWPSGPTRLAVRDGSGWASDLNCNAFSLYIGVLLLQRRYCGIVVWGSGADRERTIGVRVHLAHATAVLQGVG